MSALETARDGPAPIETARLLLLPAPLAFIRAMVEGQSGRAGAMLGVRLPRPWPDDPAFAEGLLVHLEAIERDLAEEPWRVWVIALRAQREAIGSTGFKGPPDRRGTLEIGWTVNRPHRGRGYATEAAAAMLAWGRAQPGVRRVIATIARENLASEALARRIGMSPTSSIRHGLPVWVHVP
jgi:ribosomal-protein-alanine N-acetyltransferase